MSLPSPTIHDLQEHIVEQIKRNDEETLRQLYLSNYPAVERYVLQNSGTEADVKDVFQEAFIAVWRNVQSGRFSVSTSGSIHNYLLRVAKNKWLDVLRQKKRQSLSVHDGIETLSAGNEAQDAETEARLQSVKESLKYLNEQCRELLFLFYYRKESLRNIADVFSWSENTAKNNKYRCLQKLRSLVLNHK